MIKKARIEDTIYDVITFDEYKRNMEVYNRYSSSIAIENEEGYIFPIRTMTDNRPGFYPNYSGEGSSIGEFKMPSEERKAEFAPSNIINFSEAKNFREIIEAQDKLNKAERSILTTADNITIPEPADNDSPFMKAIKTAIVRKRIDLDKYAHRFGNNFPNDKRLLKKDDMTLQKGITYASCLDFDIYAIIKDSNPDVANPIGDPIVVKLTGDNSGFTDEFNAMLPEITSCGTQPVTMPALNAAYNQSYYNPNNYVEYISPNI